MYTEHAILVNIPDAAQDADKTLSKMTKNEIRKMVIDYAIQKTEYYEGFVFDFRYLRKKKPVLFSRDDWNGFEKKLLDIDVCQKAFAIDQLPVLEEVAGSINVLDLLRTLLLVNKRDASRDSVDPEAWFLDCRNLGARALLFIAKIIWGEYFFDSLFYDIRRRTALVPFIGRLKETPDDWALVLFDYHI